MVPQPRSMNHLVHHIAEVRTNSVAIYQAEIVKRQPFGTPKSSTEDIAEPRGKWAENDPEPVRLTGIAPFDHLPNVLHIRERETEVHWRLMRDRYRAYARVDVQAKGALD
jgi:hypothetical protein